MKGNTNLNKRFHFLAFLWFLAGLASVTHGLAVTDAQIKELLEWDPPVELKEAFPYYLAGYDDVGNPVWSTPFGRWPVRWLSEGGKEFQTDWVKYVEQMLQRMYQSPKNLTNALSKSAENSIEGFIYIIDMDGYSHEQFLHPPTIKLTLEMFQVLYNLEKISPFPGMKLCFGANVNFAGRSLWTIISSQLGPFASKFELHGTDASRWKKLLLRHVPQKVLPKSLGGSENFKPLALYGK